MRWTMVEPDLALDVVADDRDAGVTELAGPLGVRGDEDGDGVDEGDTRIEAGLGVVALGPLGADREVGDQDVGPGLAQRGGHVDRLGGRLLDRLGVVLAQAVEGRPTLDGDAELAHLGEADRVVLPGVDRLAQVGADLGLVHVEGRHRHEVADVVPAELDVHEAGDDVGGIGVVVVGDPLDERAGAVADAGNREADGVGHGLSPSVSGAAQVTGSVPAVASASRSEAMRVSSQLMSRAMPSAVCWTTERA